MTKKSQNINTKQNKPKEHSALYKEYVKANGEVFKATRILKFLKEKKVISGKTDIGGAILVFLIKCRSDRKKIHEILSYIYGQKYNYKLAEKLIQETSSRVAEQKNVLGVGTVIRKVKKVSWDLAEKLLECLENYASSIINQKIDEFNKKFEEIYKTSDKVNLTSVVNNVGFPMLPNNIFKKIVDTFKKAGFILKKIANVWSFIRQNVAEKYEELATVVTNAYEILMNKLKRSYTSVPLYCISNLRDTAENLLETIKEISEELHSAIISDLGGIKKTNPLINV